MKFLKNAIKPIKNNRGMLTAEFLFAFVLCAGMCAVLFALNFTLSMAEVAQYMAFSSSRAYAAAHLDEAKQADLARTKYKELLTNKALKSIFNKGEASWFVLSTPEQLEISSTGFSDYPKQENRVSAVGVRLKFEPKVLNMRIAFLGSTAEDPDKGFSAYVTSFLTREPTHKECWEQMKPRYENIIKQGNLGKLAQAKVNEYVPLEDNGC